MADVKIKVIAEDAASGKIKQVEKALGDLGDSADSAGKKSLEFGDSFELALMAIDSGMNIARQAIDAMKKVIEFSKEGAEFRRMQDASASLAKSMGTDMTGIVEAVKEASHGTVSTMDIMAASSRALMLGVGSSAEDMARLMEVAAVRGRAMGLDTTKAFNDIVTGIGRTSPMILDNLGIVLDIKKVYADYATEIGKTADQLTVQEEKQALVNAVIADTAKLLRETGGLTDDASSDWEKLQAAQDDYFKKLKAQLSDGMGWWAKYWTEVFDETNKGRTALEMVKDLVGQGLLDESEIQHVRSLIQYNLTDELNEAVASMKTLRDESIAAETRLNEFGKSMAEGYAAQLAIAKGETWETVSATDALVDSVSAANDGVMTAADAMKGYSDQLLFSKASMGLTDEQALALASSLGLVDERTVYATERIEFWQQQLNDGLIDVGQYNFIVGELAKNLGKIKDKSAKINIDIYYNEHGTPPSARFLGVTGGVGGGGGGTGGTNELLAAGGVVNAAAGTPTYWVGEAGPEPFIPAVAGRIVSNTQATQALRERSVGAESSIVVNINTPFNFADDVWVANELAPYIRREMREALRT